MPDPKTYVIGVDPGESGGSRTVKTIVELPKPLCDKKCNTCPIILHPNSRLLTVLLNKAYCQFGDDFYKIVQEYCPNLTVCYDCRIDDFIHVERIDNFVHVENCLIEENH